MLPVDLPPERGLPLDGSEQRRRRLWACEEGSDLRLVVPRLRHHQRLSVPVLEVPLLPLVVEQVIAIDVWLRVVVESDPVGLPVVLGEQLNGRPAAGVAVLRVIPARPVLRDVVVEWPKQSGVRVVTGVLDRAGDEVEAAVLGRGVADVGLVLGGGVCLDELDLDAGLALEDPHDRRRCAFGELVLELWPREVQHLHDERVGGLASLPQSLQSENCSALLGVGRVLVTSGTREPGWAADHAGREPVRQRGVPRGLGDPGAHGRSAHADSRAHQGASAHRACGRLLTILGVIRGGLVSHPFLLHNSSSVEGLAHPAIMAGQDRWCRLVAGLAYRFSRRADRRRRPGATSRSSPSAPPGATRMAWQSGLVSPRSDPRRGGLL